MMSLQFAIGALNDIVDAPADAGRATILPATYAVVIFSLLVQALTLPRVVRRLGG